MRSDLTICQSKKKKKGICINKRCRRKLAPGRNKCYSCIKAEYRARYPIKAAYDGIKYGAKRRNIPFDISLEYFTKFCHETSILEGRGIHKHSYHVDRIREELGYVEGNLQKLKNYENVKKYRDYNHVTGYATTVTIKQDKDTNDCPF